MKQSKKNKNVKGFENIREVSEGLSDEMLRLYEVATIYYVVMQIKLVFDELRNERKKK
jgi:hypothetical protein